jgi:NADPH2:quinone reductase
LLTVEMADPRPGPGEVTIEVKYAGVWHGRYLFRAGAVDLGVPFTPGIEVTGHALEAGPGVDGFEAGQPVAALLNDFGRDRHAGGYAEVAISHGTMTAVLPEGADLARAAAVLVNGVSAWIALHDVARLDVQDDVLVLGAGGAPGRTAGRFAAVHPARRVSA